MSELSKAKQKADKYFSLYIRQKTKIEFDGLMAGYCPLCSLRIMLNIGENMIKEIECCFHIIKRGNMAIRWDERNAVGSCHTCNNIYNYDERFIALVRDWYDDWKDWNELVDASIKKIRLSAVEVNAIAENWKQRYNEIRSL